MFDSAPVHRHDNPRMMVNNVVKKRRSLRKGFIVEELENNNLTMSSSDQCFLVQHCFASLLHPEQFVSSFKHSLLSVSCVWLPPMKTRDCWSAWPHESSSGNSLRRSSLGSSVSECGIPIAVNNTNKWLIKVNKNKVILWWLKPFFYIFFLYWFSYFTARVFSKKNI